MAWKKVTLSQFMKHEFSHGDNAALTWNGLSPGAAAVELDITRQGVHAAVDRGLLEGIRVMRDGRLAMLLIPQRAIDHYRENHSHWASLRGRPVPWLQKQA